ncbi:MAG TPA: ATP-binding protein [Candidatus Binatia bacterium]|nr:ATP-binding protein [Candidatus Binatia bacterium]
MSDREIPAASAATAAEPARINLQWLVRLRWVAIAGQLATIWIASLWLAVELALVPLHLLVAVEAASNLACAAWLRRARRVPDAVVAGVMALDVLLLTGLFEVSGGASNPFTSLYLVNIALAAVVLPPAWTWSLVALALACFGALFLRPVEGLPSDLGGHAMGHGGDLRLHLEGMWVAFGVAATFIVYFVQRVSRALAGRERELAEARAAAARAERLASLATLAAGAAHELSTPLSTIAVVARELERELARLSADAAADVRLIREQVERCRTILIQMAADAGESTGEDFAAVGVAALVERALDGLADARRVAVAVDGPPSVEVVVPPRAVAQALRAVVKNALQASPPDGRVDVRATCEGARWRIAVSDRGAGMEPAVLARAFEPFFTTKPTGKGMGLGLFLARDVLERIGGAIQIASPPQGGTTAVLSLPGPTGGNAAHAGATRTPAARDAA